MDKKRKLGSGKSGKWFQVARILLNVNRGELESESVKFVKSIGTDFFHCFVKHVSHETTRKCQSEIGHIETNFLLSVFNVVFFKGMHGHNIDFKL